MSKSRKIFVIHILAVAIILGALSVIESCHKSDNAGGVAESIKKHCTYEINEFILDKLEKNRVVMLGDREHHSALYLQSVSGFLNFWLDSLKQESEKEGRIPRRLFLVLEMAPREGSHLEKYIATSNLFESFSYGDIMWEMNTARLEFYDDLRLIKRRIDSVNTSQPENRKISFGIIFPEKNINMDKPPSAWNDTFFISERDEYSSKQIIDSLENHPDYKALIFYGQGHFNKFKMVKKGNFISGEGYYMAYYLEKRFKNKGGIFAIYQKDVNWMQMEEDRAIHEKLQFTHAIDYHLFKESDIPQAVKNVGGDGDIVYFNYNPYYQEMPIAKIQSRNLIKYLVDSLEILSMATDSFNHNLMYNDLRALTILTGSEINVFHDSDKAAIRNIVTSWKRWYDTCKMDMVADIDTLGALRRLIDLMAGSKGRLVNWYESFITNALGMEPSYDSSVSPSERADEYRGYLKDFSRRLRLTNLVNLLWIGTDEEKRETIAILKRETGQNYGSAKEWAVWWRQNYEKR